jgi:hypothetical protein
LLLLKNGSDRALAAAQSHIRDKQPFTKTDTRLFMDETETLCKNQLGR